MFQPDKRIALSPMPKARLTESARKRITDSLYVSPMKNSAFMALSPSRPYQYCFSRSPRKVENFLLKFSHARKSFLLSFRISKLRSSDSTANAFFRIWKRSMKCSRNQLPARIATWSRNSILINFFLPHFFLMQYELFFCFVVHSCSSFAGVCLWSCLFDANSYVFCHIRMLCLYLYDGLCSFYLSCVCFFRESSHIKVFPDNWHVSEQITWRKIEFSNEPDNFLSHVKYRRFVCLLFLLCTLFALNQWMQAWWPWDTFERIWGNWV